jgi:hypothetical protein
MYGPKIIDSGNYAVLILYYAHVFGVGIHTQGDKWVLFGQLGKDVMIHSL